MIAFTVLSATPVRKTPMNPDTKSLGLSRMLGKHFSVEASFVQLELAVTLGQFQLKMFGRPPLSPFCNRRCSDIAINRFCLLDTAADGLIRAEEFSNGGGEPEPYVVIEVWRKRGPAPAARPLSDL